MTLTALPAASPAEALDTGTLPHRRFGKTEERVPVIGLGTGPAGIGMTEHDAVALFHAAIDRGVTYIDTAPGYGQAHLRLGYARLLVIPPNDAHARSLLRAELAGRAGRRGLWGSCPDK